MNMCTHLWSRHEHFCTWYCGVIIIIMPNAGVCCLHSFYFQKMRKISLWDMSQSERRWVEVEELRGENKLKKVVKRLKNTWLRFFLFLRCLSDVDSPGLPFKNLVYCMSRLRGNKMHTQRKVKRLGMYFSTKLVHQFYQLHLLTCLQENV